MIPTGSGARVPKGPQEYDRLYQWRVLFFKSKSEPYRAQYYGSRGPNLDEAKKEVTEMALKDAAKEGAWDISLTDYTYHHSPLPADWIPAKGCAS